MSTGDQPKPPLFTTQQLVQAVFHFVLAVATTIAASITGNNTLSWQQGLVALVAGLTVAGTDLGFSKLPAGK